MWEDRYSICGRLILSLLISIGYNGWLLEYCVQTVLRQARSDLTVAFAFSFALVLVAALANFARLCIVLLEARIVSGQKAARRHEEMERIREERQRLTAEATAAGTAVDPASLPSDEEINDLELDVEGWEDKGHWLLIMHLIT
ncbi:E3 ubiquitin-protein ligase hrd1, partial [Ascosphaera acerosa]